MQLGLRIKFVALVLVAAVVPLLVVTLLLETLGYRYLVREKGELIHEAALQDVERLKLEIDRQMDAVDSLINLQSLPGEVELLSVKEGKTLAEGKELDRRWPQLSDYSPEIRKLLHNPVADQLRKFQVWDGRAAELLVTDWQGNLLAASRRTTDFWQADEGWWQQGAQSFKMIMDGVGVDQSAGVFSLDVVAPLRSSTGRLVGVMKVILDVSAFFERESLRSIGEGWGGEVVLEDGRIVSKTNSPHYVPLSENLSPDTLFSIENSDSGWILDHLNGTSEQMVGIGRVRLSAKDSLADEGRENWAYVLIHQDATGVLTPLRAQLGKLIQIAAVMVLGFSLVAMLLAEKKIIEPLNSLRRAARAMIRKKKSGASAVVIRGGRQADAVKPLLLEVDRIATNDEIQSLAKDFSQMAYQLLRYQDELESEIAEKTAEITNDLNLARKFQEALLPKVCPIVPASGSGDLMRLKFHQIYLPATTLGGDFFDLLQVSEHQAGVFLADVMGHGARSALVTAIIRTLLHNLVAHAEDPGAFLNELNAHFHRILSTSDQVIFSTAFFMIADTRNGRVSYASASHPGPLKINRESTVAEFVPLEPESCGLGLFPATSFVSLHMQMEVGDILLLYTDGLIEASSDSGEEYGIERLRTVLGDNHMASLPDLAEIIMKSVRDHAGSQGVTDDVCLILVEAASCPDKFALESAGVGKNSSRQGQA